MLEYALAGFETQVQAVKAAIALLQHVDHPEALQVMLEAAVFLHAGIQGILAGMPERRVAQVVGQRNRLHQVLVQAQVAGDRTGDLRDFDAVGQAGAEQIAFVIDEHLGLVFQAPESGRMDNAVAIALELGA